jgi:hypothetical protein
LPFARWSSYRATAGLSEAPPWLHTDWLLSALSRQRQRAIERYRAFVAEGKNHPSPWAELKHQSHLGSEAFVERVQAKIPDDDDRSEIPRHQRRPLAKPLADYAERYPDRDEATFEAYASGGYRLREIGEHFGLHYSRLSRIVRRVREAKGKTL